MTSRKTIALALLLSLLTARALFACESAGAFIGSGDNGRAIRTAVRTYTHPGRVSVTLVSTVHVGSADYFAAIRDRLHGSVEPFDSVLVEGVARSVGEARAVSHAYAPTLGLIEQSAGLRLAGPNVLRVDLDGTTFDRLCRSAGVQTPVTPPPASRRELADGLLKLADDPAVLAITERAYLVRERNDAAIQTLRHRMARGDRSIALVYGAAHGPDLHRRLIALGFVPQSTTWLTAFAVDTPVG